MKSYRLVKYFNLLFFLLLSPRLGAEVKQTNLVNQAPMLKIDKIFAMNVDSSINPATFNYLQTGVSKAKKEAFDAVLIRLNTPGGLVSTTKDILTMLSESGLPIFVWVTPEGSSAASAGAIIASGAHILAMSPGTNIGAATPIELSQEIENKDLRNKAINDLVALVQSLAESRGRNTALFGKMVREAASYKSQEALETKLIDFIASSNTEFIQKMNHSTITVQGRTSQLNVSATCLIKDYEMDLGQKLLNILANPNLSYILFLLGAALIYLEFQSSGFIAGGIGAICLLLAGIGFQVLPLNFGALGLLILAFIMFLLETFVVSYGLLSIAGLASLIIGSLFLFRTDEAYISVSYSLIASAIVTIASFTSFIAFYLMRDSRRHKSSNNYYSLAGRHGVIVNLLPDEVGDLHYYQIKIGGEIWKASSQELLQVGDLCTIKKESEALVLIINKKHSTELKQKDNT